MNLSITYIHALDSHFPLKAVKLANRKTNNFENKLIKIEHRTCFSCYLDLISLFSPPYLKTQ